MRELIRSFDRFFAVVQYQIRSGFALRGTVVAQIVGALILILLQIALWKTLYGSDLESFSDLSFEQVVFYAVVTRVWLFVLPGFSTVYPIENAVRNGGVSRQLLSPMPFVTQVFGQAVGRSVTNVVLVVIPSLVLALTFVRPVIAADWVVAVGLMVVGYLIAFFLTMLVGIAAFFTTRIDGLNEFRDALVILFGGAFVPLSFYPDWLEAISRWLPFAYIYYVPIGSLVGDRQAAEFSLLVGVAWAVALLLLTALVMRVARRRLVIFGG